LAIAEGYHEAMDKLWNDTLGMNSDSTRRRHPVGRSGNPDHVYFKVGERKGYRIPMGVLVRTGEAGSPDGPVTPQFEVASLNENDELAMEWCHDRMEVCLRVYCEAGYIYDSRENIERIWVVFRPDRENNGGVLFFGTQEEPNQSAPAAAEPAPPVRAASMIDWASGEAIKAAEKANNQGPPRQENMTTTTPGGMPVEDSPPITDDYVDGYAAEPGEPVF